MNEEYLKGLHGSLGITDEYSVWVEKVKGNDEYLKGLHGSIGVKDDYDTWKGAVWGDVKKKEETISPEPSQISTESVQEPIESPLISSESKPSQPEASTTEDTPQVIGTQPNANGFFELSNTGVEGNYSDKTAAGTGYDPSYSTGGSDMLADIYSQPSSPMLFSSSEQEVAMDVFKKSVHSFLTFMGTPL